LPPAQPKEVIGDLEVCKGNNKARYEVGENDASVCTYQWTGLPTTAKIQPAELIAGSSPARYSSGATTYKVFIDWATTPPGTYTLSVVGKNEKSDGTEQTSVARTFKVVIKNCGFEFAPNPVCLGQEVLFNAVAVPNAKEYIWDNGKFGQANDQRFFTATTNAVYKTTYDIPGTYDINLQVNDNTGKQFFYSNRIVAVSCNSPTVVTPVSYCKGALATAVTATASGGGTNLKWYNQSTGGAPLAAAPTPSTASVDTITYWVSQQNATGESERTKLEVIVADAPVVPSITTPNPLVYCKGAASTTNELLGKVTSQSGTTLKWYSTNTATTASTLTAANTAAPANLSWFVSQSKGSCESGRAELKIQVVDGPQFTVEAISPVNCGDKGKVVLKGLTASSTYQVAYNTIAATAKTTDATGNISFDLPQGTYKDFKVSVAGCSSTVATPYTITDPSAPTFTVAARQPKECGALGAIVLKGLKSNTAYKISYNSIVDEARTTTGDSMAIILPKGDYTGFKVNLNGCMKTDAGSYKLSDPVVVPPVVQLFDFTYCQNQQINTQDITSRVQGDPNYSLRWYASLSEPPTNTPTTPSTATSGSKSIWVTQANVNGCESDRKEIVIRINPSTILTVTKQDPSTCGTADGKLLITGLDPVIKEYNIEYKRENQSQPITKKYSDQTGKISIDNLAAGKYSSVTATPVSGASCFTNSNSELALLEPGAVATAPEITGSGAYCSGSPISLKATSNSGGIIEWYSDAALQQKLQAGDTYQPATSSGAATFYAVESTNGCKGPAGQATINVAKLPTVQEISGSGGPASCNGAAYPIDFRTEVGVVYTIYKDGQSTEIAKDGTGATVRFEDIVQEGTYTVKGKSGTNCEATMTGELKIVPSVGPQVFTLSGGAQGCEGSTPAARISLSGTQANVEYKLTNTNQTKTGDGGLLIFEMESVAANNGTYKVEAIDPVTGCSGEMNGSAVIDIKGSLMQPSIDVQPSYCNQAIATIQATNVGSGVTPLWSMTPTTAGTISSTGNITWASSYSGPATIQLQVSNSDCGAATKTATAATNVSPAPVIGAIEGDSLACRGNVKVYRVSPSADITYEWAISTNASLSEENDSKSAVSVTYNIDIPAEGITLIVTPNSKACGAGIATTKVIKKDSGCDLFVPNILTPGSADNNSVWSIEGINNYPKLNIQIFNRWGGQVYSNTGLYTKPWEGPINGKPLPTATYYYVIDKGEGSEKVTGSVTVVRD
jgi:gliding motility-associated-like protein